MFWNEMKKKSYNWLLDYDKVIEWITQYKSNRTQKAYLLGFNEFCEVADITPVELLEQTPEQSEKLLKSILDKLSVKHNYPRLAKIQQSVNSYLRYYGKKISVSTDEYKDEFGRYVKLPEEERVYGWLLEYDEIYIWINNYTSKATRESYLGHMNAFLKRGEINPKELLELSDNEVLMKYTLVKQDFLQNETYSSARGIYKVVKSFFEAHRRVIPFSRQDKVPKRYKRIAEQHIPTKEEIYKMADNAGTLRNRAVILCLFQSGVRSNCIRRWNYGLVKDSLYPKLKVPVRLRINKDFDTKLIGQVAYYYTFLQDEAAEALKTYIDWRKETEGWDPKDDDILFVSESFYDVIVDKKRLYPVAINRIIKQSAKDILSTRLAVKCKPNNHIPYNPIEAEAAKQVVFPLLVKIVLPIIRKEAATIIDPTKSVM